MARDVTERLLEAIRAAAPLVRDVSVGRLGRPGTVTVHPGSEQAAAQPAIDSFDWSGAAHALWERARVAASLDAATEEGRLLRSLAAVLVDELNILRQRDRDRAADVAAATSLADLKTRWAARPALNDRTLAQAKQAVRNRINDNATD